MRLAAARPHRRPSSSIAICPFRTHKPSLAQTDEVRPVADLAADIWARSSGPTHGCSTSARPGSGALSPRALRSPSRGPGRGLVDCVVVEGGIGGLRRHGA
ncbi:hypothetical protein NL676_021520 [Syzygium grande]|nr:hypothetical protein NL676_021520 [Syzygium grande]